MEDQSLPQMRPNNYYLLEHMRRANGPGFRALDYGCGDGALVFTARSQGIDAYGAETYYDGARPEDLELVRRFDPQTTYVRTITDGKLPFPDAFFDMVVANQVFEHIHDLCGVAREIRRVLKPGGAVLSIFPIKSVVREPHLVVPLIHRFPKWRFRRPYFRVARKLSRRARRVNWGTGEAAIDKALWFLDTHTCYRTVPQVKEIFAPDFSIQFVEPEWLAYRLPVVKKFLKVPGGRMAAKAFSRLAAGTVMLAHASNTAPAQPASTPA